MPYYDYECPKCGTFEIQQRMTEPALTHHDCGSPVTRIVPMASFTLKGGGWYADGYGASSSSKSEGTTCTPSGCEKPGCAAKSPPS